MVKVLPSDALLGGDMSLEEIASALHVLADCIERDEELHEGNVEWLQRIADCFDYQILILEQAEEDGAVARAEALVEGDR